MTNPTRWLRLVGLGVAILIATGLTLARAEPTPRIFPTAPPDPTEVDDEPETHESAPAPPLKKLTAVQINRIRFMELRGMRLDKSNTPDRVSVKIPRDTIDEFLTSMEGHPDFHGQSSRRAFLKKTAPQKLHYIARYGGARYADKVTIKTDPEIFVEFQRNVMPTVLRSCATSACHASSNEDAMGFRLFKDPKKTAPTAYANFIVLNELEFGGHRVLDRSRPNESLLLNYMMPRDEVRVSLRHPGEIDYKPVFRKTTARRFKRIKRWIAALKHPAEDYDVYLIHPPKIDDAPDGDEDEKGELAGPRPPDKTQPKNIPGNKTSNP